MSSPSLAWVLFFSVLICPLEPQWFSQKLSLLSVFWQNEICESVPGVANPGPRVTAQLVFKLSLHLQPCSIHTAWLKILQSNSSA